MELGFKMLRHVLNSYGVMLDNYFGLQLLVTEGGLELQIPCIRVH